MIAKDLLEELYFKKALSVSDIAKQLGFSPHKVQYWMDAHQIKRRSISDAVYLKHNPNGDPFIFCKPSTVEESELFGYGMGLYWGEGTKADKSSVRLGNSDPELLLKFIEFLVRIFSIDKTDLRFSLQLFNDVNPQGALDFWSKCLKINKRQFYKSTVSKSVSQGTYKKKAEYGVLTLYYHNKKLRDLLVSLLPM